MTQSLRLSQRSYLDTESRAMIYHGCSTKQLAEIFNMKEPDVMRRLAGVDPVDIGRQGNPLYRIRDAAARLVKIPITPEMIRSYMRRLNPKELPPALNKMFWEGEITRRKFRQMAGELWTTEEVIKVASEAYQAVRMALLLIPDLMIEESELSDAQLKLAQTIIDNALEDARDRLITHLRNPIIDPENEPDDDEL